MYGTGGYPPGPAQQQQPYPGYGYQQQPQHQPAMPMGGGPGYGTPSPYPQQGYPAQGGYNGSYMPPPPQTPVYGGGAGPGYMPQQPPQQHQPPPGMMQGMPYGGQPGYQGGPGGQMPPSRPESAADNTKYKLQKIFNGMDKDRDGRLSEEELRGALINGDYTKFNPETVKVMVKMFDRNRNKSIDFEEFVHLWKYLADWRKLFARFDADGNDTISLNEFSDAMRAFGYRLSQDFVRNLFSQYSHTSRKTRERVISFDMFVQCCISVKRMTEEFKKFDTDRDGLITLEFEQFLTSVMNLR